MLGRIIEVSKEMTSLTGRKLRYFHHENGKIIAYWNQNHGVYIAANDVRVISYTNGDGVWEYAVDLG